MSNWEAARRRNSSTSAGGSAGGGGEVCFRGLGAAPRVTERVTELDAKMAAAAVTRLFQFEGEAVQARGPFEPESFGGLVRAGRGVAGGLMTIAGALEVHGEHFGIWPRGRFERVRQPGVAVFQRVRRDLCVYGFANAIVPGLDFLTAACRAGSHEVAAAQGGHHFVIGSLVTGGLLRQVQRDGLAGDGDDLQQAARGFAEARDAGLDHRVQRLSPGRHFRRPDQFGNEERIARRIASDGSGTRRLEVTGAAGDLPREVFRLRRRETFERQFDDADGGAGRCHALQECGQERASYGILRAITRDQEKARRVGRLQQIGEQGGAVGVPPVEIVDEQDQGRALRQAAEEFAQGCESALPQFLEVGDLDGFGAAGVLHFAQDGEQARQCGQIAR